MLLVCVSLLAVWAQAPRPDTPAARQFFRWLEVFNRGDGKELTAFLEANFVSEQNRPPRQIEFREMTGGFDFKKTEESEPTRLTGVVKERDGDNYARFTIEVEAEEPHRVKSLRMQVVPRPDEFPAVARMGEKEALTALRVEADMRAGKGRFSGAILVARNGQTLFSGAYGLADREKKVRNRVDTRFRIGSMNKMFTAVSVAQLAQAGKIKLDAPLGTYLKEYPNQDVASKVTIHHLLTHTGGTGDIFGPKFDENRLKLRELKDYVALYGTRAPQFEPGARFAYSNYGYLLLGVVIEAASGQSYYDYVREHVYKAAGMTRTDSLAENEEVADRSVGYTKGDGTEWRPNTDTLPYRGTSAGGGYSTVEDLGRFAAALLSHKLLNAEYTTLVTTGKVSGGPAKYAYGFMDSEQDGVRSFGHGGGAPGMNGDLRIFPESGYVVAVLANQDPPAAQRLAGFISARLPAR
jgi:CubicO group peptidase (beta-lactamase class C family)